MTNIQTINDLKEAVINGDFTPKDNAPFRATFDGTIIDEQKSIKWNKEEVDRLNEIEHSRLAANRALQENLDNTTAKVFANKYGLTDDEVKIALVHAKKESTSKIETIETLEKMLTLFAKMK